MLLRNELELSMVTLTWKRVDLVFFSEYTDSRKTEVYVVCLSGAAWNKNYDKKKRSTNDAWATANCKSGSVKIIDRTGWFNFGSVSTHCCTVFVSPFLLINTVPRKFKLARFTFFAQPFLMSCCQSVAWQHKERLWSGLYWSDVTLLLHGKGRFSWNLCLTILLASKLFFYVCKKEYMIMQLARLWVFWYLLKLSCSWIKMKQTNF